MKKMVMREIMCAGLVLLGLGQASASDQFPIATNPAVLEIAGGAVYDGLNYFIGYVAGTNVYGQLVSQKGELVGTPSLITSANIGFPPAVVFAGARTNCLVVWSDYSKTSGVTIFGRIVIPSGHRAGPTFPMLLSAGAHGFQKVREVASDGTNYLALWVDAKDAVQGGCYSRLYGQFVTGSGVLTGTEFAILSGTQIHEDVALAFGKTNYLVAWQQEETHDYKHTYCRVVNPTGQMGPVQRISVTPSLDSNPLAISFDGTNYLVLWTCSTNYGGPGELMLFGRFVSQGGAPLGDELVIASENAGFPAAGFDGANHLVLWTVEAPKPTHTVRGGFVSPAGEIIGPLFTPFVAVGPMLPCLPTAVCCSRTTSSC
ncbi:MAG: hypothetical protein N3G20_09125 [Verrucomicrobiae bacterium]|nr:hypothetical protein [Verrucomicrobiae bacterium]